jgi:hypothetical protein
MRSRGLGLICLWSGVVLLACVLGWLIYRADLVSRRLVAIDTRLTGLQDSLDDQTLDQALIRQELQGLDREISGLTSDASPFISVAPHLRWVPIYGGDLAAAPALLHLAHRLTRAGVTLAEIMAPLDASVGAETLPVLAQTLAAHQEGLAQVEALLLDAQAIRSSIDQDTLSPALAQRLAWVDTYLPHLRQALPLLQQAADMMGAYCPRTYLLLGQNQDELRPTGGYITVAGHLVWDQGRIASVEMRDTYALDDLSRFHPRPPEPLYAYMGADLWLLRDANWSPDFPTSARQAAQFYWTDQRVAVDGVIAFDQAALPRLLEELGTIEVVSASGVDTVTAQNVMDLLQQRWAPGPGQTLSGEWWKQRKSFMLSLTQALLDHLQRQDLSLNTFSFAQDLNQALREKHILLASDHPAWAQVLAGLNWDGAIRPGPGDLLAVVDANVGFNKASAVVERQTDYQVKLHADGSATAYASLVYQHHSQKDVSVCQITPRYDPVYTDMMDRCYWNYVRLLVPEGTKLNLAPHSVVPATALLRDQGTDGQVDAEILPAGYIAWGQLLLLAPGETAVLDFAYDLPVGTATRQPDGTWQYLLRLPKQAGTDRRNWQVSVQLPEGARLLRSMPQALSASQTTLTYELSLDTDQEIIVRYRLGGDL